MILNFGHSSEMLAKEGEESVNSLLTKKLVSFVKGLDSTRPVTAGCNEPNSGNHLFRSGALDMLAIIIIIKIFLMFRLIFRTSPLSLLKVIRH